jgi:hypothetical protein
MVARLAVRASLVVRWSPTRLASSGTTMAETQKVEVEKRNGADASGAFSSGTGPPRRIDSPPSASLQKTFHQSI